MAVVAPSFNDFVGIGEAAMKEARPGIAAREGDVTTADLHAAASMADLNEHTSVEYFARTFLDYCSGTDLEELVNDHWNLQKFPASPARVALSFTRTSAGAAGTIPVATPVSSVPDAEGGQVAFLTDQDFIVPAGQNGPFLITATAQTEGPAGNVAAGTVTQLGTSLFDSTFTVTNPDAAGGGNIAETDDELRERARAMWTTMARGTKQALEFGAKTVPGVRIATVTEDDAGHVSLMVTDADGHSTLQMVTDVQAEIENWRAAGVYVEVVGGNPSVVDLRVGLRVRTGFDVEATAPIVAQSVETRMKRLGVGEALYQDMIVGAIVPLYPDDIFQVQLLGVNVNGAAADPAADPIPTGSGTVVRPGTITIEKVA